MKENVVIFPHNKRAYDKVCSAFKSSNRTCVIQPTGTGKMYIAMQLMDAHPNEETLYLTSYSPILSALDAEMKQCGVISKHLTPALYAGLNDDLCTKKYDYIIMDEFHRAGAEVWGTWVAKLLEHNPDAKILGLSATPIRYLDNNRDMSDELFDGNIASSMTLAEAIGVGILKMPKYVCAVYSLAEELERYKERIGKMKSDANKTEALMLLEKARRSLEQADGLPEIFAQHMTVHDGRYIVFCRNYEHMETMKAECHEWFKGVNAEITMYEIRKTHSDAVNEQTLSDFNADNSPKLKLLFVVNMLNEGVHLKNVDGCIMLRPTESMNVFLQQLGRAISVGTAGHTTIFDIVNNSAQLNAFGSFKTDVERAAIEAGTGIELEDFEIHEKVRDFWEIVSRIDILLTNKSWEEWFLLAQEYYLHNGNLKISQSFVTPSGERLGFWIGWMRQSYKLGKLSAERQEKLETIGMVWNLLDERWGKMYDIAVQYYKENGSLNIPGSYVDANGNSIGLWLQTQRTLCRQGKLSSERQRKLEAIGMIWEPYSTKWGQMFALAEDYFMEHGHLRVPDWFKTESGKGLGAWIGYQRAHRESLSPERIYLLETIGMMWAPKEEDWNRMFNLAKNYFIEHGNLSMSQRFVLPSGEGLGYWVSGQKDLYKNGRLSAERQEKLESIGIVWNSLDAKWNHMFLLSKAYFEECGNLNIPQHYTTTAGEKLGQWIGEQRTRHKNGSLGLSRKKRLESIGMVWDTNDANWRQMYDVALRHHKEGGSLDVTLSFVTTEGDCLGAWLGRQRMLYRQGNLSIERQKLLESIGIDWDPVATKWDKMFSLAEEYFRKHGNLMVPWNYKSLSGEKLGEWLRTQRRSYQNGSLPSEKKTRLDTIGMVWSATK